MMGLEGHCKELGPKKSGMRLNWELHHLVVEMAHWRSRETPRDYSERRILYKLKLGK